ncbi:hypothetical protein C475_01327 [Halosimplex carlsbadense 2-9-1]|uniref:HTH marR-type domain-containing protein n=1 Tax=Halosimplex carlsbadense 2-9-1 TaxID=797114 RepID=M0D849_9EURY|nr:hypothetical protein C475_01327 [Halosimplex carlsbadense 2-9-1]
MLDAVEKHPDASPGRIADEIGDVPVSFVERVFEELGDPTDGERPSGRSGETGEDRNAPVTSATGSRSTARDVEAKRDDSDPEASACLEGDDPVREPDLAPEQRAVLRAVAERPSATQAELAEILGASRATVSKRLNEIPGFDWKSRRAFVGRVFGDGAGRSLRAREHPEGDSERDRLAALADRIERLESAVADRSASTGTVDVETVRAVVHASLDADHISREEELHIVRNLLGELR